MCTLATVDPPATAAAASNFFHLYLRRPGIADGDDTYETNKSGGTPQANVLIEAVDVHYRPIQLGTLREY